MIYDYFWRKIRISKGGQILPLNATRPLRKKLWSDLKYAPKEYLPLVIFGEGIVDHEPYIQEALPATLKFGNDVFGNKWIF